MRLLDRYLLRELLVPLIYGLGIFLVVMVVYDLFSNLGDYVKYDVPFGELMRYYAIGIPRTLQIILPINFLLALIFSFHLLQQRNEIKAILCSGISLKRLSLPYLLLGILLSLLQFGLVNKWGPGALAKTEEMQMEFEWRSRQSRGLAVQEKDTGVFSFVSPDGLRQWVARKYDAEKRELFNPEVRVLNEKGEEVEKIVAKRGIWKTNHWEFYQVSRNLAATKAWNSYNQMVLPFPETPRQFKFTFISREAETMTSKQLSIFLTLISPEDMRYKRSMTELKVRQAQPWLCLLLVLVGVPAVFSTSRTGEISGMVLALAIFIAYALLSNFLSVLGSGGLVSSMVAAWLPNLLLLATGAILLWISE